MDFYLGDIEANDWLHDKLTVRDCWLGLHIAEPTPAGLRSTEVLGGGYERQPINFGQPSGRSVTSTNNQTFDGMPVSLVTWVGIWSDRFSGRLIAAIKQDSPQNVAAGGQYLGAAGDVTVSI